MVRAPAASRHRSAGRSLRGRTMYLADVHRAARVFAGFCVANPPRYQLIAQRTVPGFTPSAESAALARRAFGAWRAALAGAGITAVVKGVVDQQITVDPTGDRFLRHLDVVIDMFLAHTTGARS